MTGEAIAIIVAGGEGVRMDAGMRKQYLKLNGLPILSRTILALAAVPEIQAIYLVVPKADFAYCESEVMAPIALNQPITLVAGGKTRQESVYNGLFALPGEAGIVVIHDGVRPFAAPAYIRECIQAAGAHGACIVGVPASDTIKQVTEAGFVAHTLDRQSLWMAQTPQAFDLRYIRKAHEHALSSGFAGTDDASIIEHYGGTVRMIQGGGCNIKITTPADLKLAQLLLDNNFLNT